LWRNQEESSIGLGGVMKENWEKRGEDGEMIKLLGENRGELVGIKRYLST
jgi:hypothetical protein